MQEIKTSARQILRHHARARNAGEKHARDPGAVWARPIALASDPVAAGRPRPGPRARVRVTEQQPAGPPQPINLAYAAPDCSAPTHQPALPESSPPDPLPRFCATDRVRERPPS